MISSACRVKFQTYMNEAYIRLSGNRADTNTGGILEARPTSSPTDTSDRPLR